MEEDKNAEVSLSAFLHLPSSFRWRLLFAPSESLEALLTMSTWTTATNKLMHLVASLTKDLQFSIEVTHFDHH